MDFDTAEIQNSTILADHFTDYIGSMTISPDGMLLAVGSENAIMLWDTRSSKHIKTLYGFMEKSVVAMAFNQKGTLIAAGSDHGEIAIWDIRTGEHLNSLSTRFVIREIETIAFSPDETKIVIGCKSYNRDKILVILWDIKSGQYLETSAKHEASVTSVAFSPDGRKVASGSYDNTITICDVETGSCLKTLKGHTQSARAVVFSPDGSQLISGSRDCSVRVWDLWSGKCIKTYNNDLGTVDSIALNQDCKLFAFFNGNAIRILDMDSGKILKSYIFDSGEIYSAAFSPDGKLIVSEVIRRLKNHEWDSTVTLRTIGSGTPSANNFSYCTVL